MFYSFAHPPCATVNMTFSVGCDGSQPVSAQAEAAVAAVPGGTIKQYVAPRAADLAVIFRVDLDGVATTVVADPYTAKVVADFPRRSGWYDFADNVHGSLLLDDTGDLMIEIAVSPGMVLTGTGLYMWWPRGTGWRCALIPSLSRNGRDRTPCRDGRRPADPLTHTRPETRLLINA